MSFLNFLKAATIEEPAKTPKRVSSKQRNPNPLFMGIRLWADGSIYPSQALVDKFSLEYPAMNVTTKTVGEGETAKTIKEYTPKEGATPVFGFDVIDSSKWTQFKVEGDHRALLFAPVTKDSAKVDLFGRVTYDETGVPLSSVMDQGSATFGKEYLVAAVEEIYGVKLEKDTTPYVDLEVDLSFDLKVLCPAGIFLFPKTITRGEKKGLTSYERRENVSVFGIAPTTLTVEEEVVSTEEGNTTFVDSSSLASDGVEDETAMVAEA